MPSTTDALGAFALAKKLQTFGRVRGIDETNRRVTVVVSTGDVARDDAIIEQRGWSLENYDKNPVVLWAHDDTQLPIAKALPELRRVTDNELIEVHEFADHPQADYVFRGVVGGFINATSVRWIPGVTEIRKVGNRNVLVFTQGHELLETSYVPIPADPGALVMRADAGRLDLAEFGHKRDEGDYCSAKGCRSEAPIAFPLCQEDVDLLDEVKAAMVAGNGRAAMKAVMKRMTIVYSMECSVKGCPNDGWDATLDVCMFHHAYLQGGDVPMPGTDDGESTEDAGAASEDEGRKARLLQLAERINATNKLLKEGAA